MGRFDLCFHTGNFTPPPTHTLKPEKIKYLGIPAKDEDIFFNLCDIWRHSFGISCLHFES